VCNKRFDRGAGLSRHLFRCKKVHPIGSTPWLEFAEVFFLNREQRRVKISSKPEASLETFRNWSKATYLAAMTYPNLARFIQRWVPREKTKWFVLPKKALGMLVEQADSEASNEETEESPSEAE
jgi:hypothetical protein